MQEFLKVIFELINIALILKKGKELTLMLTTIQICEYPGWIISY